MEPTELEKVQDKIVALKAKLARAEETGLPINDPGVVALRNEITEIRKKENLLRAQSYTLVLARAVTIDCTAKLFGKGIADIHRAFNEDLGFKIPLESARYVEMFPNVFEFGDWSHSGSVLSWLQHNLVGNSVHSVVSLDSAWEGILQGFLPGLTFYPRERPDHTIIVHNHCIVMKVEAKKDE